MFVIIKLVFFLLITGQGIRQTEILLQIIQHGDKKLLTSISL